MKRTSRRAGKEFLKRLTELKGNMPWTAVAKKANIPTGSITNYTSQLRVPKEINAGKLSKAFGVDMHWLMTGKGEKYSSNNNNNNNNKKEASCQAKQSSCVSIVQVPTELSTLKAENNILKKINSSYLALLEMNGIL